MSCGGATTPPTTAWSKALRSPGFDQAYSVRQTLDGGYIAAGITGDDVWLIKTDPSGIMAWNQTFGGLASDYANSVQQTSDGGYIIAGSTNSYGAGDYDVWLIKTNPSGIMSWNETFGGPNPDEAYSVQQTSDGGYIIAGYTDSYGAGSDDVWLIKTGPSGIVAWNKTFGGPGIDYGGSVQQTSDGGYIIAGGTAPDELGSSDVWLIKTDSSGIMAWNKTLGGPGIDLGWSVQQTSDGGYIIVGYTDSYGAGDYDIWLIKTYPSGTVAWNQTFGGPGTDYGWSVQQTSDGGYIIAGTTNSYGAGGDDGWLIKTVPSGIMAWNQTLGGSGTDVGRSVRQTSDGGCIIAGYTDSYGAGDYDVWLVKVTA